MFSHVTGEHVETDYSNTLYMLSLEPKETYEIFSSFLLKARNMKYDDFSIYFEKGYLGKSQAMEAKEISVQ